MNCCSATSDCGEGAAPCSIQLIEKGTEGMPDLRGLGGGSGSGVGRKGPSPVSKGEQSRAEPVRREENHFRQIIWT